jgi:CheY-like chemotaxis protein
MGDEANWVLVAEGDDDLRSDYESWLGERGHQVLTAANGLEALELARAHRPRVVVMNLRLPVLDGWATLRALRRDPRCHCVKMVALAPFDVRGGQARAAGCDAVLRMPLHRGQLVSLVAHFIPTDCESIVRVKAAQPSGPLRSFFGFGRD